MKAPKCRLCGVNHWGNCDLRGGGDGEIPTVATVNNPLWCSGLDNLPWRGAMLTKNVNSDIDGIPVEVFVNNIVYKDVSKPATDRKEYMREYMRKRRGSEILKNGENQRA